MNVIAVNLEGEAAEWTVVPYDEGALDLENIDAFLEGLRARFRDPTQAHRVESDICSIRQGPWNFTAWLGS